MFLILFLRYTEKETTAAPEPADAGPATLSPTQRYLPDGTDETLRDIASVLVPSNGALHSKEILHIAKFTELIIGSVSQAKAEGFLETQQA